jgi:GT2 family glycosyltransferase
VERLGSDAPRCAAIVPTLDRAAQLEACLRSIAAMRPAAAEIVVVDQGAGRSVEPLAAAFGARHLHLERRGLSRARNAAFATVSAPWLWFPDDDCTAAPDLLAQIGAALSRAPQAGFVAARVIAPQGWPVMKGMDLRERALVTPEDALATVMSPGLFVARRVIERCGGFDESFGVGAEWPSGEESDLLFRALAAGERGWYAPGAVVTHPEPFAARDPAEQRRRARLYGRGWGALFAKHAAGPHGSTFGALRLRFERRALGGAALAALALDFSRAARSWQSWLGRREGWRGWRASRGAR